MAELIDFSPRLIDPPAIKNVGYTGVIGYFSETRPDATVGAEPLTMNWTTPAGMQALRGIRSPTTPISPAVWYRVSWAVRSIGSTVGMPTGCAARSETAETARRTRTSRWPPSCEAPGTPAHTSGSTRSRLFATTPDTEMDSVDGPDMRLRDPQGRRGENYGQAAL